MFKFFKKAISLSLLLWVAGFFVFFISVKNIKNNDVQYIENSIVLTGGQNRIEEAIKLIDNNLTKTIFLSGVNSKVTKQDILNNNFEKYKDNFFLGYEAVNTKGNVIESKKWIKEKNIKEVRIITSDYHVYRSKVEFNKTLPEVRKVIYSIKSIDDNFLSSFSNWKILFREYNKFIYVFIGTWSGLDYVDV